MKPSLFLVLCLVIILPACAPKSSLPPAATAQPTPVSPFNYDAALPFDTKIISQTEQNGVSVTELSYAAHDPSFAVNMGGRTVAILVRPKGDGPFAGLLYMHWLGTVSSDRHEYLNEAIAMAGHGAVSLLPQGYFPWSSLPTGTQADRPLLIGQANELRRALDFLLAQPGVDPKRLGYIGHDYGGLYGGILAGIDKRLKTYVLIAGAPSFSSWIGLFGSISSSQYLSYVEDIDPVKFVPNAAPASLFFQFGKRDAVVPESLANQYYAAASQPKKIEWYDDIHDMHSDPVVKAHQAWLIEQLNLDASDPTPKAGQTRMDDKGIEQVWAPAGSFEMGSDAAAIQALENIQPAPTGSISGEFPSEQPQHEVHLTDGYWIDKYEVTNQAFRAFVEAGGYTTRSYWSDAGWEWLSAQFVDQLPRFCLGNLPDNPVACVTWYEAEAYAAWRGGRLPTEAEWEYAARGPNSLIYPWGNEFDSALCNLVGSKSLQPVGRYPGGASWVGALDMAGNVMEWVQDWLGPYPPDPLTDPTGPTSGKVKVEKGGWWGGSMFVAHSAYRHFEDPPEYSDYHIGFRIMTP